MDTYRFRSHVEVVQWGRTAYTVIRVPEDLAALARERGTRRVAGSIDGVAVNAALNRAPVVEGPFLYAGKSLLRRMELEPGEQVDCALSPVDPDIVALPDDVRVALERAGSHDAWEALRPSARRRLLQPVEAARRPDTRARRIDELVSGLHGPT